MPELLMIAASGTAQRRLLEETAAELEKKGYAAAGKTEGGEWRSLLSDNMTGGLFDENRYIVVESAALLDKFPPALSSLAEKNSSVLIVLVYESKKECEKFVPKNVLSQCKIIEPAEFPKWANKRIPWVINTAKSLGIPFTSDGAAMIVELLDDPEEIRAQIKSLGMLKSGSPVSADDVRELCLDDGSKTLLRLLDGLCNGDCSGVLKSLHTMAKNSDIIPALVPIQNRMRLAWYASLGKDALLFKNALAAGDYAWRMASGAAKKYGRAALTDFMAAIIKINIDERSGVGESWPGLETAVITLMASSGAK